MIWESLIAPEVRTEMLVAASQTPLQGCFVEVGVYRGGSAISLYRLAQMQRRGIYLFDTFTGTPHATPEDKHKAGEFADGIDLAAMLCAMPEANFCIGVFPDTLPLDMPPIAFAHIDCDQYASIGACITWLWPLVVHGGVMWFDDYGHIDNARRAVLDHFAESDLIAIRSGGQVYVRKS